MNPTGLVIGKFMPGTMGHKFLCDFAHELCGPRLHIVVCSQANEPIGGLLRAQAMTEAYPRCTVVHLANDLPHAPSGSAADIEAFWQAWHWAIMTATKRTQYDFVFASEGYGRRLASLFDAQFVPLDVGRRAVMISATIVRANLLENWDYIMPEFRRHFVKRVAIVGAESTGKTSLARDLAIHFETEWCPEWARGYLEEEGNRYPRNEDYRIIARAQAASENAMAKQANRVLISDTDVVCTSVAAKVLNNFEDPEVDIIAADQSYDLRILLDTDFHFTADPLRYGGDKRQLATADFVAAYAAMKQPVEILGGSYTERLTKAILLIRRMMAA